MNFDQFYLKYKKKISAELNIFLANNLKRAKSISNDSFRFTKIFNEYILRDKSKRLRGLLLVLGYLGHGGRNEKEIIKVAAFMELAHNYLLIHDDIIDRDDYRRNGFSLHKEYSMRINHVSNSEKAHYGRSMAIVAGDLGSLLGQTILMEAKFTDKNKIAALKKVNRMLYNVIQGEALDVMVQAKKGFDYKSIYQVYKYKTAYYSIANPLEIGAILAGAKEAKVRQIEKFAIPLGIAFQIQDDMLGLFSDQLTIGKPIGSDIREGKKTLILYFGLKMCRQIEKKFIKNLLGKNNISLTEIKKIRGILVSSGAVNKCNSLIQKNITESQSELCNLEISNSSKNILTGLIDYINNRKY
jgi:geranylgeranyl diphosphate synthase, type I